MSEATRKLFYEVWFERGKRPSRYPWPWDEMRWASVKKFRRWGTDGKWRKP